MHTHLHTHAEPQVGPQIVPRSNFDSVGWALLAVFQILTMENWNEIMVRAAAVCKWAI